MRLRSLVVLAALSLAACADPLALRLEVTGTRVLPARDGLRPFSLEINAATSALEVVYTDDWNLAVEGLDRSSGDVTPRWAGALPVPARAIASLGERQHAVLGDGIGYHFDERAGSWHELFCFFPGDDEGEWPRELDQRSVALAHDPSRGRLWAQPRTFRDLTEPLRSEIAAWDDQTGEEVGWWTIDTSFQATAMAVLPDEILVLADWRALHAFDPASGAMAELATLEELDVVAVRAMVWDPVDERLLVLEMPSRRMLAVAISR